MKQKRLGFPCEFCKKGDATKLLHTDRRWLGKRITHRRHRCKKCNKRFNTIQIYKTRYKELCDAEEELKCLRDPTRR